MVDWQFSSGMTYKPISGIIGYGYYHGGGSPIMAEIALLKQYDIDSRKEMVRHHACIGTGFQGNKFQHSKELIEFHKAG